MKKLYLAILPSLLIMGCSSSQTIPAREALTGNWVCLTKYEDLNVGMIDTLALKPDGSLEDENLIFDHTLSVMAHQKIDNYFKSIIRYKRVNNGSWDLSGNTLTYNLKMVSFKRLIPKDAWVSFQKMNTVKKVENELFKIYSSQSDDKIQLKFNRFIDNGFILTQDLNSKIYDSVCLSQSHIDSVVQNFIKEIKYKSDKKE